MPIQVSNVFYTYQKKASNSTKALEDISLCIEDNEFIAIVGETGSGKSTLAQMLNALLIPDEGQVEVDDIIVNHKKRKSRQLRTLRKKVGLVFQFPECQLFEETVEKDVAFGCKNYGMKQKEAIEQAHKALEQVGLDESYYKRAPFDLSGGERRKVAIAGILAIDPDVLIFDEPTVGFDPASSKDLMRLICEFHKQGKTIIVITHDMNLVNNYAQKTFLLEKGRLIFTGTPSELFKHVADYDRLDIPDVIKLAIKLNEKGLNIPTEQIRNIDDLIGYLNKGGKNHE